MPTILIVEDQPSVSTALQVLFEIRGVVAKAAEALGLSRQALYRKMEKHGLAVERRVKG